MQRFIIPVPILIVVILLFTIAAQIRPQAAMADECPVDAYARPGLPAVDIRVTADDVDFPELRQGESSSIALDSGERYLIAWQSVNADHSQDNDIYVLREQDHDGLDPQAATDCPLPLTSPGDGAFHSQPSVAVGLRITPGIDTRFLVGWTSQILSPSQAPSLRKAARRRRVDI